LVSVVWLETFLRRCAVKRLFRAQVKVKVKAKLMFAIGVKCHCDVCQPCLSMSWRECFARTLCCLHHTV